MAVGVGFTGRKVLLTIGGAGSIAIQEKSVSINNEPVDVSSDTSNGWTTMLAEPGNKNLEIGFSGVVENLNLVMSIMNNVSQIYACTLTYPEGSIIAGDFFFGSLGNTGPYKEAFTFEASLSSSGAVTFTAGT
tara:strand:- start:714 stop:1112 length:399 start_codon:yes stop_codon:yes gene_type:complete